MEHGVPTASSTQGKGPSKAPHWLPQHSNSLGALRGLFSHHVLPYFDPLCTAQANTLFICSSSLNLAPLLYVCPLAMCV